MPITTPTTPTDPASPAGSVPPAVRPRRRSMLLAGAGAAALLAGCSDGSGDGSAENTSAADGVRSRGARDSAALLARYDATIAAHPPLAELLRPLREETARHAEAFGGRDTPASGSPSPSSPAPRTPAPKVPSDEPGALKALADAERRTADTRTGALADAPPELARLLASVAACGAAHSYLLTERKGH